MALLKKFVPFLLFLLTPTMAHAQLGAVPYTFTAGNTILSAEVNSNFSTAYANALNRTGGTMTGTLTAQAIAAAANATYDIGAVATKFKDLYLSGQVNAATAVFTSTLSAAGTTTLADTGVTGVLTVTGTVVASGTVTASGFSGSGASLTALPAAQLSGTITAATQDLITRLGTITSGAWSGTTIGLAKGGTNADLSATGGASQFLRQNSAGAAITVVRPASSDLSDGTNLPLLNAATNTFTGKLVFGTTQTFSWNAKIVANVYQAASDGFVVVWEDSTGGGGGYTTVLSDAANPPTTVRGQVTYLNDYRTLTIPIRKGDYYKVVDTPSGGTASYTVYWVPLGTAG